jgi:hypothetical protein
MAAAFNPMRLALFLTPWLKVLYIVSYSRRLIKVAYLVQLVLKLDPHKGFIEDDRMGSVVDGESHHPASEQADSGIVI